MSVLNAEEYDNPNRKLCDRNWVGFEGVESNLEFYLSRCLNSEDVFNALKFAEDGSVTLTLPLYRFHDLINNAMNFE